MFDVAERQAVPGFLRSSCIAGRGPTSNGDRGEVEEKRGTFRRNSPGPNISSKLRLASVELVPRRCAHATAAAARSATSGNGAADDEDWKTSIASAYFAFGDEESKRSTLITDL